MKYLNPNCDLENPIMNHDLISHSEPIIVDLFVVDPFGYEWSCYKQTLYNWLHWDNEYNNSDYLTLLSHHIVWKYHIDLNPTFINSKYIHNSIKLIK